VAILDVGIGVFEFRFCNSPAGNLEADIMGTLLGSYFLMIVCYLEAAVKDTFGKCLCNAGACNLEIDVKDLRNTFCNGNVVRVRNILDAMAIVVNDHFRVHQNGARILVSCEIV